MRVLMAVAAVVLVSGAAQAADPIAFDALQRGELGTAQAKLASRVAEGTREPGVLLNLAHVYGKEGRRDEAVGLYQQVLARSNVLMEMANGRPAWSHDLAKRGIARLSTIAMN
jgi:Flp pilus assembly protein TadD